MMDKTEQGLSLGTAGAGRDIRGGSEVVRARCSALEDTGADVCSFLQNARSKRQNGHYSTGWTDGLDKARRVKS